MNATPRPWRRRWPAQNKLCNGTDCYLTRRIVTFCRIGPGWRPREEVHRLALHRPADVLRALRSAGLRASPAAAISGSARLDRVHREHRAALE